MGDTIITHDYVAPYLLPYIFWAANLNFHGYDEYINDCNKQIVVWTRLKAIALMIDSLKGKYEGGKIPALDDPGSPIDEDYVAVHPEYDDTFTMVVDCGRVSPVSDIVTPNTGISLLQRQVFISQAVENLWTNVLTQQRSPVCLLDVYADNSNNLLPGRPLDTMLLYMEELVRGAVDSNGIFYLLSGDFAIYAHPEIFPESVTPSRMQIDFSFSDNNSGFFIIPSYNKYSAATCDLIDRSDPANPKYYTPESPATKTVTLKLKGRVEEEATEFGGYIIPATFDGEYITSFGSFKATEGSWCSRMFRDVIFESGGFEHFAGAFNDHPLITGVDTGRVLARTNAQKIIDLNYVNNYVNSKYGRIEDGAFKDKWTFLGQTATAGDCEDFAITKAQMLLDLGWTVHDLKLMYGCKQPRSEAGTGKGHMWLEVAVGGTRYALDNSGLKTPAEMVAAYPYDRLAHDKLTWTQLTGDCETLTATPIPHDDYSATIFTATCEVSKY
jgi:predicted transglutaminase-like cysteine proteinase